MEDVLALAAGQVRDRDAQVAQVLVVAHQLVRDALDALAPALEAVAVVVHHHAEVVAHQVVPLLVEVDAQEVAAVVVLQIVAIHVVNNALERAVAVVICAITLVLVVMGVVNNTAQAVQALARGNATLLARDTIKRQVICFKRK